MIQLTVFITNYKNLGKLLNPGSNGLRKTVVKPQFYFFTLLISLMNLRDSEH